MVIQRTLAAMLLFAVSATVSATTFYVDPVNGSDSGDGSQANPWKTIDNVIDAGLIESYTSDGTVKNAGAPIKGGDTVLLLDGYHENIDLRTYYNNDMITIAAADGHTPRLTHVYTENVKNWTFRGLDISPSNASTYTKRTGFSVNTSSNTNEDARSRNVILEDSYLYSVEDSSAWGVSEWMNTAMSAVGLHRYSREITVRNCHIKNVRFGMNCGAHDCLIENNFIEMFSADGIRATGPGNTYLYNTIQNCHVSMAQGDPNHDDGIQGYLDYNPGGTIADVTIIGNKLYAFVDNDTTYATAFQGIGCFDGPFVNWVVKNNLVVTDSWHGISLYRSRDCVVTNNTAVNPYGSMTAWIEFEGMCINNTANNNITRQIRYSEEITRENNLILTSDKDDWDTIFVDWENLDFRLCPGSPAIDTGTESTALPYDADGNPRPQGMGIDRGAFETPGLMARAGDDITVDDLLGDGVETVSLDASDSTTINGGTLVSFEWYANQMLLGSGQTIDAELPVGENEVSVVVTDSNGLTGADKIIVTVNAKTCAIAGDDQTVYDADGNGSEVVTLDGSASNSSEGDLTDAMWFIGGNFVGFGLTVDVTAPLGQTTYTLVVFGTGGITSSDDVVITVTDEDPVTPGDANRDGSVNIYDFLILRSNYGIQQGATWEMGNFDGDSDVDMYDFLILRSNYGS